MAQSAPPVRLRRLGMLLRRRRDELGLTLEEAAALIRRSKSALGRIENGQCRLHPHEADYILIKYGVTDQAQRDPLLALAAAGSKKGWFTHHSVFPGIPSLEYVGLEWDSTFLGYLSSDCIPGLVQTEEYAYAITRAIPGPAPAEHFVGIRMRRQQVLEKPDPPHLVAVITEGALRLKVGGNTVMKAQLERLGEVSQRSNISIRVLPFEVGAHPGIDGSFVLMDIAGQLTVVLIESFTRSWYLEDDDEVRRYFENFNQLLSLALSEADSRTLIAQIHREL